MSRAKVLYIHITGASSEVLKNLVLAGICAVLCDPRPFPDAVLDTPSLLLRRQLNEDSDTIGGPDNKKLKYESVAHAVRPIVEELNPLLGDCEIITTPIDQLVASGNLKQYTAIVASRLGPQDACALSAAITAAGGTFYTVDCFGMFGVSAIDLGPNYQYRPEKGKELLDVTPLKLYVPLKKMLAVPLDQVTNRFYKTPPQSWVYYRCLLEFIEQSSSSSWPILDDRSKLQDFVEKIRGWLESSSSSSIVDLDYTSETSLKELAKVAHREVAPVCSVLGGLVGNEVIKAISGKGEPANNTMLFDGRSCKAFSFLVQPK